MAFDFVARQKAKWTHLNWFILEQLPVIAPARFEETIAKPKIADFIRDQMLHLSHTAHDLAPFARDLGYEGPPFVWDESDRRARTVILGPRPGYSPPCAPSKKDGWSAPESRR